MLNHTLLGKEVQNPLLNGEPIGETRLNALVAQLLLALQVGQQKIYS